MVLLPIHMNNRGRFSRTIILISEVANSKVLSSLARSKS